MICTQTNKAIFKEPEQKYLQAKKPNEIIYMDLTDLSIELINNNNKKDKKLEYIIDNLSKFAYAKILSSEKALDALPVLMRYINIRGNPKILITDNGKEFVNKLFNDFLENNDIEKRAIRACNPKSNGIIERFNN